MRRRVFGFFSYAHEDDTLTGGAVSGLRVALENAVKLRVRHFELYQDTKDLRPGEDWKAGLFGAIEPRSSSFRCCRPGSSRASGAAARRSARSPAGKRRRGGW